MFLATGVGSLPGSHAVEAARVVAGECTDFAHLAELPARGPGADMIGRTAGMLSLIAPDLAVETTPAGWRFADAPGRSMRRATQWLVEDLDCMEESLVGFSGQLKQQLVGPWTLAASIEMRNGERALRDHGAASELVDAVAEAAREQVEQLRRRVPAARPWIQIDEPALPAVLAGGVSTASGFATYRSVDAQRARESLECIVSAIRAAGGACVVHCCAANPPLEVMRVADAVSFDLHLSFDEDHAAELLDRNATLFLGLVPTTDQSVPSPRPVAERAARRVARQLSRWGFDSSVVGGRIVLTPTCGLAGASPQWARTAYAALAEAGRLLRDEGSASERH